MTQAPLEPRDPGTAPDRERPGSWFSPRGPQPPPPLEEALPETSAPPAGPSQPAGRPFFSPSRPFTARSARSSSAQPPLPPPYRGELRPPPPPGPAPAGGPPAPSLTQAPPRVPFQAPRSRKRPLVTYLYIALGLLVAVLGALAFSRFNAPGGPRSAVVAISERGSTYSGSALVVRNEGVFTQDGVSSIRYLTAEGAAVSRGDPVCIVYSFGFNTRELAVLQTYRRQIRDYLKVLEESANTLDTRLQRLETSVLDRALETQALIRGAQGNLLNQETLLKEAMNSRYQYLKQKYPDDSKLTRLFDNENNQMQRIDTWTKQFVATDNGIISFYTDGFEGALNTAGFDAYSPSDVRAMLGGQLPASFTRSKNSVDIYRLVRQYDWAVLMLADDPTWNPVIGDEYQLLIESFDNTVVRAVAESVTRSGGDLLLRLRVSSEVDPVFYVRQCRVQLSTSTITYSVPASALLDQGGMTGVVVTLREGDFFVPVVVHARDATQAHVVPVNRGYLYEGLSVRLF